MKRHNASSLGLAWSISLFGFAAWAGPLDNWHIRDSGTDKDLHGVAYGQGRFVAVGEAGTILESPDGVTWSTVDSGTEARLDAVAFGNDVFVAVGGGGAKPMFTSANGIDWTPRSTAIGGGYLDVIFNGNAFFTLAGKGAFGISTDGTEWATGKIPTSQDPACVTFANGTWIVAGYKPSGSPRGMLWSSPDAATWTPQDSMLNNNLFGAGRMNGLFVVAGQGGVLGTSPDGETWTPRNSQTTGFIWDFTDNGEYLVAASQWGRMLYSANGIDWTRAETGVDTHLKVVTYGAGTFVAVGWDGHIIQSNPVSSAQDRPRLTMRRQGNDMVVAWPRSDTGFELESKPDIGYGAWSPVNMPVVETETEQTVTLSANGQLRIFRLAPRTE